VCRGEGTHRFLLAGVPDMATGSVVTRPWTSASHLIKGSSAGLTPAIFDLRFRFGGRHGPKDRHVAHQPLGRCGRSMGLTSARIRQACAVICRTGEGPRRLPVARALLNQAVRPEANTLHRLPAAARSDCLQRATGSRELPRASGSGAEPRHLRVVGPEALPAEGASLADRQESNRHAERPSSDGQGDR
jgi:hypothetical protein